ncbi:DUF6201 family protein [Xenorhabdus bovienii]|uniref:Uncharacterized protein n=1 Tax=Xenorhabdus bovienii str. oregonense TaxID=1398202 RepID=A0A077PB88_XENBV|nr:DUF6201 family protein [Xenorhabdus bovienii]MDE9536702.1 DUF6201 family protein [Xenorhabdus bovienii]MDE9553193.1 DUF6201 family protein [Xenorhabdus bovienii]MDE9589713.1 DUF6201 family protein [Xenorhabdus bovienii]CDH08144.1 hypothetical protein XBO1_900002 [Xenorhabdus bovienii str. oregonense]
MKNKYKCFFRKPWLVLFFIIIFIMWILFPSTLFFGNWNKYFEERGEDGQYTAVVYKKLPISPYAMWKYVILGDKYFIVLYDNKNRDIWKSSPFTSISYGAFSASFSLPTANKDAFIYPTNDGYEVIYVNKLK